MNNRKSTVTILAGATLLLAACGLKSTSGSFGLDGVGDPQVPAGDIIPGKFGGTFEATRWVTNDANLQKLTGPDLSLVQGLLSQSSVEGLAGLPLLVISTQPPARTANSCYFDLGISPELGGSLDLVDVGKAIIYKAVTPTQTVSQSLPRNPSDAALTSPITDTIFYTSDFNALPIIPYASTQSMSWPGGTLAPLGYRVAVKRAGTDAAATVLKFPAELQAPGGTGNPTINGTDMLVSASAGIAAAAKYKVQWEPVTSNNQGRGVQITVQIYGPANLTAAATAAKPNPPTDVEDLPYFNRLGQLVCIADETRGTAGFDILQSDLDSLWALVKKTTHYAESTEDVNGNGILDPGEDGNQNGKIDKVYGAVILVNRRSENVFNACLQSSGCGGGGQPVFISGNATKYTHLAWKPQ